MRTRRLIPLLPAAAILAAAAPAGAAEYRVTRTDDPAPGACLIDDCSLREAVIAANGDADASSVIRLAPGAEYLLTRDGAGEDLADTGDLDVRKSLTIEGGGLFDTQLFQDEDDRVFDVAPGATAASLTVRDLVAGSGRPATGNGGNVLVHEDGALTVERAALSSGRTQGAGTDGGNIASSGPVSLRDAILIEGRARDEGGGIAMLTPAPLGLERTSVVENGTGGDGAAIATAPGAPAAIATTTVASNFVDVDDARGALLLRGAATITDSTIAGNLTGGAGQDAGIVAEAPVTLRNTIVARNRNGFGIGPSRNCAGPITSLGHNFEDVATCGLGAAGDQSQGGDPRLEQSPQGAKARRRADDPRQEELLRILARHPLAGSPVVDAGAGCAATDQRGVARPQNGTCDIGAVEAVFPVRPQPAPAPAPAPGASTPPALPRALAQVIARPALSRLAVSTKKGRTSVRVTLDRAARLEAKISTKPRRGKARTVVTLRKAGRQGVNTFSRRLRPGRYQVAITASAGGATSLVARRTFTVKGGR